MVAVLAPFEAGRAERTERLRAVNGQAKPARRPVLVVLAAIVATVARWAGRHLPTWERVRTLVLSLAGFGLLTAAAFQFATWAGLAVAGVSLLFVELLNSDGG